MMGNENSTYYNDENSVNLAMMAVARKTRLGRCQIIELRNAMSRYADEYGNVNREDYNHALVLTNLSSVEILDLLFTLWDHDGNDKVPYKGFCIGISPLSCPHDGVKNILRFALEVCDDRDLGFSRVYDLQTLLDGIISTASYFGDIPLSGEEITAVLESTFEGGMYKIAHEDCIRRLSLNPYIRRFISGRKRVHVHFKAELVTEIKIDLPRADRSLLSTRMLLENQFFRSRKRWRGYGIKRRSPRSLQRVASLVDTIPSFEEGTADERRPSVDPPGAPNYSHHSLRLLPAQYRRNSRET
jgi:hypothetical protein